MRIIPVLIILAGISSAVAFAATPPKARIPEGLARASALKHAPGGTITSSELEKEHGKLIYSFDIKRPKVSGVDEVHIDAMTGQFLSQHHESALKESVEQKGEAMEAKIKGHD